MAFGDFVVEDGTGLPDATSYVTVEEATAYCQTHQEYASIWAGISNETRMSDLMHGTRWIDERYEWLGRIFRRGYEEEDNGPGQGLRFPRTQIYDRDGRSLAPYDADAGTVAIPNRIKEATIEAALMHRASAVNSFSADGQLAQGPIAELKVDVIEVKYTNQTAQGSIVRNPDKAGSRVKYINSLVAPFISSVGVTR